MNENSEIGGDESAQLDERNLIFISKGTPDDDDFTLWLAPRLEAAGYEVFADILCLKFGDRWRKILTNTLQQKAVKMLLCGRDTTLAKNGVQEEIGIAEDLSRELPDTRFIVPLKLERYKRLFGIGELQYVDFEKSWAEGLDGLLKFLEEEGVPKNPNQKVNPEWEGYRTRRSIKLSDEPEALTSNWLRISSIPDTIKYYVPTGAVSIGAFNAASKNSKFPIHYHNRGVLTFLNFEEVSEHFSGVTPLELACETNTLDFDQIGMPEIGLAANDAHNILVASFRQAWDLFCREQSLVEYAYSAQTGFHMGDTQIAVGKRVPWGKQGSKRSAMLRNAAKGKVWNFGATAIASLWPYPHFKIKTRVLFSELKGEKQSGPIIDSVDQQFRLRRTVCKGWRNKQWHGRLLAFLELLSGDSAFIKLKLSPSEMLTVVAEPLAFTSPVTTELPDELDDDFDEIDASVLEGSDIPFDDKETLSGTS